MKKILFLASCLMLNISSLGAQYVKYGTHIEKNINIPGYRAFDYTFWLHPGQANRELETLFTKETLDFLRKIIPEGSVAIDIGAHVGDTSVAYSLVVGDKGKVIAFEPNPSCFEVLKLNAANNPNIIPVERAVTEHDGDYTFYYTDPGLCNGAYAEVLSIHPYTVPVQVKGVNLEKWLQENAEDLIPQVKFIKIDCEGYDRYIIKNIGSFLKKYRPIIQTELFIYLNRSERQEMFEILESLDYKIVLSASESIIDNSEVKKRKFFDLETFLNYQIPTGSIDLLCIPKEQEVDF